MIQKIGFTVMLVGFLGVLLSLGADGVFMGKTFFALFIAGAFLVGVHEIWKSKK